MLPGGVYQVSNRFVGYIIADKFIQEKHTYNLNNIRVDIQQEYDVQSSY